MQDRPICFECDLPIETNAEMVFEAPCGCDHHSSAVFHSLCLFSWREKYQEHERRFKRWLQEHQRWHEEQEARGE